MRLRHIDILKGIGIISVVLGHMNIPEIMMKLIYSFHMPLFFFISGYLYKNIEKNSFKSFVLHKSRSLLWPFITFSIFAIILFFVFQTPRWKILIESFWIYIINLFTFQSSINVPLWFLPALFGTYLLVYFVEKKLFQYKVYIYLIFISLGFILAELRVTLWFNLHIGMIGLLFFVCGIYYKKIETTITFNFIVVGFLLFLWIGAFYLNIRVDMYTGNYGNQILFIISSLSGIILIYQGSKFFTKYKYISKILVFFGINSLLILALHSIVPEVVQELLVHFHINSTRILQLFIKLLSMILLVLIIKRYFYFMVRI